MAARAVALDKLVGSNDQTKHVLTILIGRNDLAKNGFDTSAFLAALAAYCDSRRSAGWIVLICTLLSSTATQTDPPFDHTSWENARNIINPELRLWTSNGVIAAGKHADGVIDFAANALLGASTAADNTTYFVDKTHPTDAGKNVMFQVAQPVLDLYVR